jgi:uracil-DNA glycosylase
VTQVLACTACPKMMRPAVSGTPVLSPVMLVGQAPGIKEGPAGKPFAWTAGKTLFQWFSTIGLSEDEFRARVYMAAVCRCFPGKATTGGGDRVPAPDEIARCGTFLAREMALVAPRLVIPVGKLAIAQFVPDVDKLAEVVGTVRRVRYADHELDMIALPHPSGASTWHRMEPGKSLLAQGLQAIAAHPAWREVLA